MDTTKIEYQVLEVEANDLAALSKQLNGLGESGWVVIAVLPLAGSSHIVYMMKRGTK